LVYLLAGASAAVQGASLADIAPWPLYVIAGGSVLYISGLTLAARQEHLTSPPQSGRYLTRLLLTFPVLFPLFVFRARESADAISLGLVIGSVVVIWAWIAVFRKALSVRIPQGIGYAIAGIALYDACVLSFTDLSAALVCLIAFALALIAQRWIPAT
ncbi:MAG: hypothetical protein AAF236_09375, partial [Verrucomicrobiota bacterium]